VGRYQWPMNKGPRSQARKIFSRSINVVLAYVLDLEKFGLNKKL